MAIKTHWSELMLSPAHCSKGSHYWVQRPYNRTILLLQAYFYLLRMQRWTGSACTGSPNAPWRVSPWSRDECRSHCSRRSRRARTSCSPPPWRRWAERCWSWWCVCVGLSSGRFWLIGVDRQRLHTEEAGRWGREVYKGGQKCWHDRRVYSGSTSAPLPVRRKCDAKDPRRTGWITLRGEISDDENPQWLWYSQWMLKCPSTCRHLFRKWWLWVTRLWEEAAGPTQGEHVTKFYVAVFFFKNARISHSLQHSLHFFLLSCIFSVWSNSL